MGYKDSMRVLVPEGTSGYWQVERFTVDKQDAQVERLRALASSERGRGVPAGTYTRLMYRGSVVMSDTPDEMDDHLDMVRHARDRILINGLGLGMVLQACLERKRVRQSATGEPYMLEDGSWEQEPYVTHATVIECDPDVIALVAPHYQERYGDRLEIIQADAYTWQPPKGIRYHACWHDIWSDLCPDNLADMTRLKHKYARRTDWQGCWSEGLLRYEAKREKRERARWNW